MIVSLYPHCLPVKGFNRSIICDLQECIYYFIPNDLYDLLVKHRLLDRKLLIEEYGGENSEAIDDYLLLLEKHDSVFELNKSDTLEFFPKLDLTFDEPSIIDNAIVDTDNNLINLKKILPQLEDLCCVAVLVRVLTSISFKELKKLIDLFKTSVIQHLDIIVSKNLLFDYKQFQSLFQENLRLNSITIFECERDEIDKINVENFSNSTIGYVKRTTERFNPSGHCASITPKTFVLNIKHFSESQHKNNCLNKKMSIDIDGNIKNCPSLATTYGNINKVSIVDIAALNDFKKLWLVKKDSISVCRDCEFRYICSDCRSHIEDNNDVFSKPPNCDYDPYSGKWSDDPQKMSFREA